jgi:hypothetical protein
MGGNLIKERETASRLDAGVQPQHIEQLAFGRGVKLREPKL